MPFRPLTIDELDRIVQGAARGEYVLDEALSLAMFGTYAPEWWNDWPQEARDTWDAAVSLWSFYTRGRWSGRADPVSVEEAWLALEESAAVKNQMMRLSWNDLAMRLGTLPRKAEYQIKRRLGFVLMNQPPHRLLVRGPCVECGEVYDIERLTAWMCGSCLEDPAEQKLRARRSRLDLGAQDEARATREDPDGSVSGQCRSLEKPVARRQKRVAALDPELGVTEIAARLPQVGQVTSRYRVKPTSAA